MDIRTLTSSGTFLTNRNHRDLNGSWSSSCQFRSVFHRICNKIFAATIIGAAQLAGSNVIAIDASISRFVGSLMPAQSESILNDRISCSGTHKIPRTSISSDSENNCWAPSLFGPRIACDPAYLLSWNPSAKSIGSVCALISNASSKLSPPASTSSIYVCFRNTSRGNLHSSSLASCSRVQIAKYGAEVVPYVTVRIRYSHTSF